MATVSFENVTKKYGEVTAVDDLSLDIVDGEFMVFVGPSGCGKTTSLRMIAGLEDITAGTLRIGDRVVNDVAPKDRDIAMVFQSYALYPHMTVRDNLAFGLKLRKVPKDEIEKRVNEAAGILDLGKYLDRKPKELSGGQRQRVALGRAIVREPAVFLMDEPLSNLDAKLRVQTRAEILRLHQRLKTTMVYVTHDQTEAMTMGTRIAVMTDGKLQQVGSPQALYDTPVNKFVGGFIGSPSMNFIDVTTVASADGRLTLEGPGVTLPIPAQWREIVADMTLLLAPMAPHLGEEVWELLGQGGTVLDAPWPGWDAELAADDAVADVVPPSSALQAATLILRRHVAPTARSEAEHPSLGACVPLQRQRRNQRMLASQVVVVAVATELRGGIALQKAGVGATRQELRVAKYRAQESAIGAHAVDARALETACKLRRRFLARRRPCDHLRQHRVVVHADHRSRLDAGIDAQSRKRLDLEAS